MAANNPNSRIKLIQQLFQTHVIFIISNPMNQKNQLFWMPLFNLELQKQT